MNDGVRRWLSALLKPKEHTEARGKGYRENCIRGLEHEKDE